MRMRVVTLYGKAGCHLCDEARAVVERARQRHPFELRASSACPTP
jgi:hypothetical protein